MNTPKSLSIRGIVALVALLLFAPLASRADTYQLYTLASDNRQFVGLDATGNVYLSYLAVTPTSCVGGGNPNCFATYTNGVLTTQSPTLPSFIADNGTPCSPGVPAGGSVQHGVCNNSRDAFTGWITSGSPHHSNVYVGPSLLDIFNGGGGLIFMNSIGDIVFDDQFSDNWIEAIDLNTSPVPEPSSLLLLATGTAALAAFGVRRRQSV